jgi:L-malate glycosyltransferase
LNVLLVVPWDQTHGGVAAVVNNLARQLRENGHDVAFFHPQRSAIMLARGQTKIGFPDYRLRLGVPFMGRFPLLSPLANLFLFPLALGQLLWLIRRRRIDIVNVHYPTAPFGYFAFCRLPSRIRLVTSVHGADIFPKGKPRDVYAAPLRFLLRRSDIIVANSAAFQEDFLRIFPLLRDKTTFVHNGVDLAELNPQGGEAMQPDGRYILCVAAHNEKKALDVLLRAFALLIGSDADIKLVLVGDGPLRGDLEVLAAELGLGSRVIFAGARDRPAVAQLLHGCELFVLPSRSEPFGIAVIEAMAVGKAVVASRTGGIPELVEDGEDGLLVEPDNDAELASTIKCLLHDSELRSKLASRARNKVRERFQWRHTGAAYSSLFQAIER